VFVAFVVIVVGLANLSFTKSDTCLWTSLISGALGYLRRIPRFIAMSQFYLTLPSNSSMDYYPEKTVARFTTKLNNLIELEGDWEVELAEISIPSEVENVVKGHCYYNIYIANEFFRKIIMRPGHYVRMRNIIRNLHEAQRTGIPLQNHEPLLGSSPTLAEDTI